jgi:hypothetical protein
MLGRILGSLPANLMIPMISLHFLNIDSKNSGQFNYFKTIEAVPPVSIFFFGNHYGIGDCGKLVNE